MSITIITRRQQVRRFIVWDLEWVPGTYQLRLCGVYDTRHGYRAYKSIHEFMRCELTPNNHGVWFFAHFGGVADLQFVVEEMCKPLAKDAGFSIRGVLKDSSIVKCTVRHGSYRWNFLDSGWLLRRPLADIAKWIGLEKTGPDEDNMTEEDIKEWFANVPIEELTEYNRNDCVILWEALTIMQQVILDLGGQMQATLPATAMQLFRRKYLHTEITTNDTINQLAKQSYVASRVENYVRYVDEPGFYYDINSSFPFAMTKPLPGNIYRNCIGTIPSTVWDYYPFIAECEVSVPETYLPPLPKRIEKRIFFPVGKWRGWFTGVDLKLLLKEGGTFQKVSRCIAFEPFYDLANYANDLYLLRNRQGDGFEKEFYKLKLNSLYGKFAEAPEKAVLLINPTAKELANLNRTTDMLFPGCYIHNSYTPIPHAHVPISSYITAYARGTLFDLMIARLWEVYYCDTDGFGTDDPDVYVDPGVKDSETGILIPPLGGLKLEKAFTEAEFAQPKLYKWRKADGSWVVKAKGFSLGKLRDAQARVEKFDSLVNGAEVRIERMGRLRENLRKRIIRPRDIEMMKGLRQSGFSRDGCKVADCQKRFTYPDGRTRPWHIKELEP
jgi:hypothetical protein